LLAKDEDIENLDDSSSSSSEYENPQSEEETQPCEGELLIVRRLLKSQPSKLEQSQQENLFHTHCKIFENICSMIMDSCSCCNSCNSRLVNKLSLTTKLHLKPYKLQWITNQRGIIVKYQVSPLGNMRRSDL